MFAVIRRYNTIQQSVEKIEQRVRDGFVPLVSRLPGFVSYDVVRATDGTLLSVSVFESRQAAEDSNRLASDWVHDNLASLIRTAPVILAGDVVVHHAPTGGPATRARTATDWVEESRPPLA
jgi:hypothetical protein